MSLLRRRMMMTRAFSGLTPVHTELEFSNANDILASMWVASHQSWGSREFYKKNDGLCIFSLMYFFGNSLCPVLVAKDAEAALLSFSGFGSGTTSVSDLLEFTYHGEQYFAYSGGFGIANAETTSHVLNTENSPYANDSSGHLLSANDLLDYYYGVI